VGSHGLRDCCLDLGGLRQHKLLFLRPDGLAGLSEVNESHFDSTQMYLKRLVGLAALKSYVELILDSGLSHIVTSDLTRKATQKVILLAEIMVTAGMTVTLALTHPP